jgi:hypothetical protein
VQAHRRLSLARRSVARSSALIDSQSNELAGVMAKNHTRVDGTRAGEPG